MKTSLLLLVLAAACAPSGDSADTAAAVPAVDTLKAAPGAMTDSMAARDSSGATTSATGMTQTPTGTKTPSRVTGTKTAPADTTNIGHDRAIQFDPKKPRIPVVDTTKRPPE